ncbi:MAG: hypothetical protein JF588_24500 [Caulobacterales bacterium]|nr:hypothetical protein [Caulobacterales bacterium]
MASIAVHVALLAVVALQAPRLVVPPGASGPPEAVIPILILPRVPPPSAAAPGTAPQPQEIRLHRRKQAFVDQAAPVAPLVAPTPTPPKPSPPPIGPRVLTLPSPEDAVAANAHNALRGALGCANASLVGLSREERQKCEDQLAAGARGADFPGLGIDAGKESALARAARRKEEDYRYKRSPPPGAQPGGRIGETASDLARSLGNDRPAATVPF